MERPVDDADKFWYSMTGRSVEVRIRGGYNGEYNEHCARARSGRC